MKGRVENSGAVIPVTFHLETGQLLQIEFVVDTGFTGALALPLGAVRHLRLPFEQEVKADLPDSSVISVPVHFADIEWNETRKRVRVLGMGQTPHIGIALLANCRFGAEFWEGGAVIISPKGKA